MTGLNDPLAPVEQFESTSVAHQDTEYEEWGFSGSSASTPSEDGRGLSTRIGSAWGATHSGVQSLWTRQDASGLARRTAFDAAQCYQVEVRARWAPYSGVEAGGALSQALRQGLTLTVGRRFDAELELGQRQVGPGADPEHAVQLHGTLRWRMSGRPLGCAVMRIPTATAAVLWRTAERTNRRAACCRTDRMTG